MNNITGTLTITPLKAELPADPRVSGLCTAPYCVLFVGNQRLQTDTAKGPLMAPYWNDSFIVNLTNEKTIGIKLCYMGLEFRTQNLFGQGSIEVDKLRVDIEPQKQWVELYSKKEPVGRLLIQTKYVDTPRGMPRLTIQRPVLNECIQKKVPSTLIELSPVKSAVINSGTRRAQSYRGPKDRY